ncbi:methylthioribulose 1-phosphate dehydratase [Nocardiopsis sp. L17-MgMaSL7]|uniref:methylthioribulose 1-phosphate dehydratase n=1 Tax=Nocardiopsis sp. L17-MgMaSL7 TaxID=1938893 RepID=UPI000D71772C|nr:methylthioribulose 1-phosphate dehydratase [Nocardiopsis sp. L17-MgMaSL7]PWV58087.1 methylthioribulose-1-phosphate dehydratase [Nocardiopsis sp. L17-MgMaSL7]
MNDADEQSEELARMCHLLYTRGWMPGTSGNISVRSVHDTEEAVITASGRDKGRMTPADTVRVRVADARPSSPGQPRPSAETLIHTALYRGTDCGAVVHVHPPYATTVSSALRPEASRSDLEITRYELLKGLGRGFHPRALVPVFANHDDVGRIGADVEKWLDEDDVPPPVLLIADHGLTSWGADLSSALARAECLEAMCGLLLLERGTDRTPLVP